MALISSTRNMQVEMHAAKSYDSNQATGYSVSPLKISKCCFAWRDVLNQLGHCNRLFSNVSISIFERYSYLQETLKVKPRTSLNWRFCSKLGSKPMLCNTICHNQQPKELKTKLLWIPRNSRRNFKNSREFPLEIQDITIPGNSRKGIPGGLGT